MAHITIFCEYCKLKHKTGCQHTSRWQQTHLISATPHAQTDPWTSHSPLCCHQNISENHNKPAIIKDVKLRTSDSLFQRLKCLSYGWEATETDWLSITLIYSQSPFSFYYEFCFPSFNSEFKMQLCPWKPHGTSVARQPFIAHQGSYLSAIKSASSHQQHSAKSNYRVKGAQQASLFTLKKQLHSFLPQRLSHTD